MVVDCGDYSLFEFGALLILSASFILYGRRPVGTSAPSMNTNSTVIAPWMSSASYGRGCSASICDEAGPTASSSMPTNPSPKNFGGESTPAGARSYTSKSISADCGDKSLLLSKDTKTLTQALSIESKWHVLTIGNARPNMDLLLVWRPFGSFAVARPSRWCNTGPWHESIRHLWQLWPASVDRMERLAATNRSNWCRSTNPSYTVGKHNSKKSFDIFEIGQRMVIAYICIVGSCVVFESTWTCWVDGEIDWIHAETNGRRQDFTMKEREKFDEFGLPFRISSETRASFVPDGIL